VPGPALPPAAAPAVAAEAAPVSPEEATSAWPDEAAESAFRAEARERGETVVSPPASEAPEVVDPKSLPSLDSLVQRIPAPVRETLEDLFRARFVKVDRVPAKSLKG
jgi:hypothetical protein